MIYPPLPSAWRALADRVVAEYRAAIGDDLVAVALFGSVARGQARPDSDLDLYVVTRRPSLGDSRLRGMWDRIDASPEYQALAIAGYRPTPSPVPHTVDDLTRHPWILLDIAHHGVVLHDPESILDRELAAVRRRMAELGSRRIELPDGRLVLGPQARLAAWRGRRPVTNGDRADRLAREARQIAGEMSRALNDEAWNLATRRAQEALELVKVNGA